MTPRFRIGDPVTVRRAYPAGHIRAPHYIRGKGGVVADMVGAYPNPEELAKGNWNAPLAPLYRVRFAQASAWPDYVGPAHDTVDIEIYEHWLEPSAGSAHG